MAREYGGRKTRIEPRREARITDGNVEEVVGLSVGGTTGKGGGCAVCVYGGSYARRDARQKGQGGRFRKNYRIDLQVGNQTGRGNRPSGWQSDGHRGKEVHLIHLSIFYLFLAV